MQTIRCPGIGMMVTLVAGLSACRSVDRDPGEPVTGLVREAITTSQAYAWKNVEIAGGGFVPGIVYSRAEAGLVYARTDIGGAYG